MRRLRKSDQTRKPTRVRRVEIVEAAMRLIAAEGARRFTVKLLAAEVGLTEGAIFRHFPDMGAIVEGVADRIEALLSADFPPPTTDPLLRLGLFFRNRTRAIRASPHVSQVLLGEQLAQSAGPAQVDRLQRLRRRSQDFVVGCLREARRQGRLAADLTPQSGAILVLGAIMALAHRPPSIVAGPHFEALSAEIWGALERTLRRRNADAPRRTPRRRAQRSRS